MNNSKSKEYYKALVNRDTNYDGIFFVGVKTTGIFCHASCRARKPKYENCEFFEKAEEALLMGYRPCKICNPLSYPNELPKEVQILIDNVEKNPYKKWKEHDFKSLGVTSYTARRKFKKLYGMTFIEYARARRMGIAFNNIKGGGKVIDQQILTGYESSSGFDDAFSKIMGNPQNRKNLRIIYANLISTPLGKMVSLTDDSYLYLLEFIDRRALETEITKLRIKLNCKIIYGITEINKELEKELKQYFKGTLTRFSTPLFYDGTEFEKEVWNQLKKIDFGETTTYKQIAKELGNEKKLRAVGNANGKNKISILIPCHRVIKSDGSIGRYGGGIERKKYLLNLESKFKE